MTATEMQNNERGKWTHASNAEADNLCQNRHLAQMGLPDDRSKDSEHGDAIHEALKRQDPKGLTLEQIDIYEACNDIAEKQAAVFFGADYHKAKEFRESRLWVEFKPTEDKPGMPLFRHSGRFDRTLVHGTKALVQDYKTLAGDVKDSPANLQLRDAACLWAVNNPLLEQVGVSIIQPLDTYNPEICVYNREHLARAVDDLRERVINSNNATLPRTPGPIQCKYCRAAKHNVCLEYQRWAGSHVPQLYTVSDKLVTEWSPAQRADFLERRGIAQRWLDQCEEAMREGLKNDPNFVPGWWLEPGNWVETINKPQEVFDRFAQLGGNVEGFMGAVSVGKEKFKKALSEVTGLRGKKLEEALKALLEGLVSRRQNRPSLSKKEEAK